MTGKKAAALPVLLHYLLVIAALSMLVDVETFFLDSLVYTQEVTSSSLVRTANFLDLTPP